MRRVIACTERSLCVWDSRSKGKNQQIFSIKPIEHSPQCVCSVPYANHMLEDTVLFGDDQGCINLLTISAKDLANKNSKGEKKYSQTLPVDPSKITQYEIDCPIDCNCPNTPIWANYLEKRPCYLLCYIASFYSYMYIVYFLFSPIRRRKLHDDWVLRVSVSTTILTHIIRHCINTATDTYILMKSPPLSLQIKYFTELRCFASCSPSSTSSFVLEEVERIYDDKIDDSEIRGVSIPKGVNAFEYCARANIIATGGVDKVIRVWHPHIFSRPTGKLIGHLFTIVDIACNEKDQHIISLSTARVFRIWDIHTLTSLQVG